MVLHLLGKKSWNVYNSESIERVRRDEVEAKAREEAEEQRMQEADATRRIAILRGEEPPPLPQLSEEVETGGERKRKQDHGLPRKRRRLRGEDDTDRDIRYAREDAVAGENAKQTLLKPVDDHDAPLIDHADHLQLFPAPDEKAVRKAEKNAEAEAKNAKKRKRDEDQYTMRFSNAAGFKNAMAKPWYAASEPVVQTDKSSTAVVLANVQDKDVWGNEDPLRKERERGRISTNDPFAAMQHAQRQLKQSERDRDRWQKERLAEVEELKRFEERKRRHEKERRRRDDAEDSLESFTLDASAPGKHSRSDHNRHRRRHRHRDRSTSRSQEGHRRPKHYFSRD